MCRHQVAGQGSVGQVRHWPERTRLPPGLAQMDVLDGYGWQGQDARDAEAATFGRPLDHKSISCQLNWNALLAARSCGTEATLLCLEASGDSPLHLK